MKQLVLALAVIYFSHVVFSYSCDPTRFSQRVQEAMQKLRTRDAHLDVQEKGNRQAIYDLEDDIRGGYDDLRKAQIAGKKADAATVREGLASQLHNLGYRNAKLGNFQEARRRYIEAEKLLEESAKGQIKIVGGLQEGSTALKDRFLNLLYSDQVGKAADLVEPQSYIAMANKLQQTAFVEASSKAITPFEQLEKVQSLYNIARLRVELLERAAAQNMWGNNSNTLREAQNLLANYTNDVEAAYARLPH